MRNFGDIKLKARDLPTADAVSRFIALAEYGHPKVRAFLQAIGLYVAISNEGSEVDAIRDFAKTLDIGVNTPGIQAITTVTRHAVAFDIQPQIILDLARSAGGEVASEVIALFRRENIARLASPSVSQPPPSSSGMHMPPPRTGPYTPLPPQSPMPKSSPLGPHMPAKKKP